MESEIVIVKFLTPYKVSMVAVILLYCDGVIPPRSRMKLLCHLVNFIDPQHQPSESPSAQPEIQLLDRDLRQLEVFMCSLHSREPGLSVFDFLVDFLFRMTSLDSLHTFMGRINEYLIREDPDKAETEEGLPVIGQIGERAVLRQSSLLGSFCKRCFLAFDSLSFDAMLHLWEYIEAFREPYRKHWERVCDLTESLKMAGTRLATLEVNGLYEEVISREQEIDTDDGDDDGENFDFLKSLIPKPPPMHCIAAENLETMLEFQIDVFERYGGTLPDEIRYILQNMIATSKALPMSAHYVQYLDAFRDKDYEAAFDHLHRFYDYTMNSRGRTHYQYALFTLATLQAEFGFYLEAMKAVDEAITMARENKDNHCLNYILSWLYSFLQSHRDCKPPASLSSPEQISQFLRIRAKETSFSLYSLSYQSEVEQLVSSGGSLTQAFESLVKSTYINVISNSAFAAGNMALVSASLWTRCGSVTLAHQALDLYAQLPGRNLNALLIIEIGVRKAKLFFLQGQLIKCFEMLRSLKHTAHGSQWHQQLWHPKFLLLHLACRLNEGKLQEAKYLLQKLSGIAATVTEVTHDIEYYRRLWEIKCGNASAALEAVWATLEESERKGEDKPDLLYQVRLMVLYAKQLVYCSTVGSDTNNVESHNLLSGRNRATVAVASGSTDGLPSRVVSLVLRIIKTADTAGLAQFACEGVVMLAAISTANNEPADALALLDGVMPRIIECQVASTIADAYKALAQASFRLSSNMIKKGVVSEPVFGGKQRTSNQLYLDALRHFRSAAHYYELMKDWQATFEIYSILSEIMAAAPQDVDNNDSSEGGRANSSFSAVAQDEAATYKNYALNLRMTLEHNRTSVTFDPEIEGSSKLC